MATTADFATAGRILPPRSSRRPQEKAMLARTMKMTVVALALGAAVPTFAETLAIDGQVAIKPAGIETPQRGSTMTAVEQKFGAPANKSAAVGNPPITKWFYPNFVVVFENDKVLHAVVRTADPRSSARGARRATRDCTPYRSSTRADPR